MAPRKAKKVETLEMRVDVEPPGEDELEAAARDFKSAGRTDLGDTDLLGALRYLARYGYLRRDMLSPEGIADAVTEFQTTFGLTPDGSLGEATMRAMEWPRCGLRDDAYTEAARWRKRELRWWVEAYLEGVPGLSIHDQDDLQIVSLTGYSSVVDVTWSRARNKAEADLIVGTGDGRQDGFDGPGGVLAMCQLPNGQDRPLRKWYDRRENWIKAADLSRRGILYGHVCCHEDGHAMGMNHVQGQVALLNAFYSERVGTLQAADRKALFALGYAPARVQPPPQPEPPPPEPGPTPPAPPESYTVEFRQPTRKVRITGVLG